MGRVTQLAALLFLVALLAAVWQHPLGLEKTQTQDFSGELVARNLSSDFHLEFTGVVWIRLFSNEPFTVNGELTQAKEANPALQILATLFIVLMLVVVIVGMMGHSLQPRILAASHYRKDSGLETNICTPALDPV